MPNDFNADKGGLDLKLDWPTVRRAFAWIRTTVITVALSGGGWHVYSTRNELADIQVRLARCEELERQNLETIRQLRLLPGNNPGGEGTGPPQEPQQ